MRRFAGPLFVLSIVIEALLSPALADPQTASASGNVAQSRITQAVDDTRLATLRRNVHPLARPEFDRGPAPADLPLDRMILVLKRSPEQESALKQLLDQQQDRSSPNYHR